MGLFSEKYLACPLEKSQIHFTFVELSNFIEQTFLHSLNKLGSSTHLKISPIKALSLCMTRKYA